MKHRKFWFGSAIVLTLVSIGAAFAKPFNFENILFRVRANTVNAGTITFTTEGMQKRGTTTILRAKTQSGGGTIICKIFDNDLTTLNSYSGLIGAPKLGSYIKFYELDGVTEYTFEDLDKIGFQYDSSFGFYLHVTHEDGSSVRYGSPYSTTTTSNVRTINFESYKNVANIAVESTNTNNIITRLKSIIITYNCTTKHQTGITVTTEPTKTSYVAGDLFDPTGMIVKAQYSNGTFVATNAYTYYPTGILSADDEYITIYHNGFAYNQPISVEEATDISGTYRYVNSSDVIYTLVLNSDFTGYYHVYYPNSYDNYMHFRYTCANNVVTFIRQQQEGDSFIDSGYNNLFTKSGSYNDTNDAVKDGDSILLKTCAVSSRSSSTKNMAKQ